MEFLAAAKQISAELMTIRTLRSDERIERFCWAPLWTVPTEADLRVGVISPPEEDDSSSYSPNIFNCYSDK
jgi:hypothetical protein